MAKGRHYRLEALDCIEAVADTVLVVAADIAEAAAGAAVGTGAAARTGAAADIAEADIGLVLGTAVVVGSDKEAVVALHIPAGPDTVAVGSVPADMPFDDWCVFVDYGKPWLDDGTAHRCRKTHVLPKNCHNQ